MLALWRDRCRVTGVGTRPVRVPATEAAALIAGLPLGRPDSIDHRLLHDWLTADD
ncbi:hypothetical protein GA0070618_2333 [Micromonospora echinospora]|uniref:Uncharacterized protein n=1 Tax=Micromonospora echinospora TaxID=1877 RepID=A0A1C4WMN1_MICEC|nr:hypothetical protein GA0070618_2333 [Micromonospora echinospora]